MKLGIMQPYFFPYIGYFQAIYFVDKYILYYNISFRKDSWINRNKILLRDGQINLITIPLVKKSSNKRISELSIDNTVPWKKKLLNKIYLNYKHARCFEQTYNLIKSVLDKDLSSLHFLNMESVLAVAKYLELDTDIETENQKYQDIEEYIESKDGLGEIYYNGSQLEKKVVRVLRICEREQASTFVNSIGGELLYRKEIFARNGIALSFIKPDEALQYDQLQGRFSPNLSIIDVLMFNDIENTKKLLAQHVLV